MNKRKPGLRSIDEWEFDGLETLAMRDAAENRLYLHQKEEREQLIQSHSKDQAKANEESLPDLLDNHRKERIDLKFNHQYQTYLVEISNDPHQSVNDILERTNPNRPELEGIIATQKLDQNFRDQVSAIQMQQFDELAQITNLHKDKVISTQAFHQMLDAFTQEKQETFRSMQRQHSDNLKSIKKSDKPLETAQVAINRSQENIPAMLNSLHEENHGKWLGDIHSGVPEALKDARYYDTPAGSILAMPTQDYELPEQAQDFNLADQFENAQAMSSDQDLEMDR